MGQDGLEVNKKWVVWMINEVKEVSVEHRLDLEEESNLE